MNILYKTLQETSLLSIEKINLVANCITPFENQDLIRIIVYCQLG